MLLRNDLVHYAGTSPRTLRILWIDSGNTMAYVYALGQAKACPQRVSLAELIDDVRTRQAQLLLIDPYTVAADPATLPPSHLEVRDRAWQIVQTLTREEPAIYQPRQRGRMVRALGIELGVSHPSVYRYLRRYWERGQTLDALLPDYKNSGAPGKTRGSSANIKRGRPRKSGQHPGLNADAGIRRTFRDAVARYAATHAQFSRRGAYRQMIEDFFPARDPEALPTFGQFNYWIERDGAAVQS